MLFLENRREDKYNFSAPLHPLHYNITKEHDRVATLHRYVNKVTKVTRLCCFSAIGHIYDAFVHSDIKVY